jgi:formylglycine-generating enzyme required for sulfatase activity
VHHRVAKAARTTALLAACSLLFGLGRGASAPPLATLGTLERCKRFAGVPADFGARETAGMVFIAGGDFEPGSTRGYPEERPAGRVRVDAFWIDRSEVTNAQFAAFVRATGYVTLAERAGAALVFYSPTERDLAERPYAWWRQEPGADWRHPEGPRSSIDDRMSHPVVQVALADALAYARWLRRTLPTEAQWEYAAKAGRSDDALHREPRDAHGTPLANFWQGEFPIHNERADGFATAAPVGCFPANRFGLFDMIGNVWEWTRDAYTISHADAHAHRSDAHGTLPASYVDGAGGARRVIKGGSFLCAASFCARYRVAARHAHEASQPAMHVGFRTVRE